MNRGWRRVLVAVGVLALVVPSIRFVSYVRAGHTLHAYIASHGDAVAAERARLATTRLPARHGPPTSVPCSDAQAFVARENFDGDAPPDHAVSIDEWPATRVTARARGWARTYAAQLDELRATLGCLRTLDAQDAGGSRALRRLTWAMRAVIVEGMVRAEDGDVAGAIERELDAIRLGEQRDPTIGSSLIADASLALARIVASTRSSGELDEIAQAVDALAPFLPQSTAIADEMKRLLVDVALDTDPDPVGKLDAPRYDTITGTQRARMRLASVLLSKRAIVAGAVTDLDAQLDRAIDALRSGRPARAREVQRALQDENASTSNPIVWLTAAPTTIYFGRIIMRASCAVAVARATVAIERTRDGSDHYASPPMLDDDPCAHGAPLRFELTSGGAGYRVWSVGGNGKDEDGRHVVSTDEDHDDDDVVAIRSPIGL